ncbi:MAG: hypothetical protein MUC49_14745 [Raineya sp.]|jgi:hypothetical protein|nr:hypothetical protein [Raineya sp.]
MVQKLYVYILVLLLGASLGTLGGYFAKDRFFSESCPDCICPTCPPQTILQINNEKLKTKNGNLELSNIIKDNTILNAIDSIKRQDTIKKKKKGFFSKIFRK